MTRDAFVKQVAAIQVLMDQSPVVGTNITIGKDFVMLRYGSSVVSVEPNADDAAYRIFGPKRAKVAATSDQILEIYNAYPRRRDKKAALKAIAKAVVDPEIPAKVGEKAAFVLNTVRAYAQMVQAKGVARDMIPYPATWFNRGSYLNWLEAGKEQRTETERSKRW